MTNKTYNGNQNQNGSGDLLFPHGGYRNLKSYQMATLVYDLTAEFCRRYVRGRTVDQMVQAARSGKQNIVEGSQAAGTSKKTELKLVSVARASFEELLQDAEDFLRQRGLQLWSKDDPRAQEVRGLAYRSDRSYETYKTYLEEPEKAANTLLCLIHQTNYLLDQQLKALQKDFLEKGGFTERLYQQRRDSRESS